MAAGTTPVPIFAAANHQQLACRPRSLSVKKNYSDRGTINSDGHTDNDLSQEESKMNGGGLQRSESSDSSSSGVSLSQTTQPAADSLQHELRLSGECRNTAGGNSTGSSTYNTPCDQLDSRQFVNCIHRSFQFESTTIQRPLLVNELMAEAAFCLQLPQVIM